MPYAFPGLPSGLKYFDCSNCGYISSLGPLLPSTLKYLDCSINETLGGIPALPSQLEYLDASNCTVLSSLPALPASLRTLILYNDQLTSLPALPPGLRKLDCNTNQLTSLPVLSDSLRWLNCFFNQLAIIPTLPAMLNTFTCNDNQLTSLPVFPSTLHGIDCSNNQLTALPTLPSPFYGLYCQNNQLTSLPTLPEPMIELICNNNHIASLPELPVGLRRLTADHNNFTCLPFLPRDLDYISFDNTINCVPNIPNDHCYIDNQSTFVILYPLCDPTNNVNHCQVFPTMKGVVYNDNNNNNVRDLGEPARANIRLVLSDGTITFTNDDGQYSLWADTLGTFTVDCNSAIYHWPSPAHYTYTFNSYDTLVLNNFAMQATATVDSLTIFASPINWAARPGFDYPFLINYENSGTTSLTPGIVLNYDNTRLVYDSCSNVSVTTSGSSLHLTEPMVAGQRNAFIAYFHVKPTAVLGDTIFTNAHATANTIDAYDSINVRIRGAVDPNEKLATPQMSRADIVAGKYIDYTIGFQNTGTDTAFNIVITDTLDNTLLDLSSLKIISSSHKCTVTQVGKIIYFEFNNIMLPDSNINEMKSHGFVRFKMGPRSFVGNGTAISNKAAIYFDYNSAVITNTAITQIMNPSGPLPLKLVSFNVVKQTKTTANVYWNTMNELNVQGFIIETSLDGRNYTGIASQQAKGGSNNFYAMPVSIPDNSVIYFRLKMKDIDGIITYSNVVILKNSKTNDAFSFQQNPAKDILTISLQDETLLNTSARIVNMQGNIVREIILKDAVVNINIRNLASGMYILQTIKGSSRFVVRH